MASVHRGIGERSCGWWSDHGLAGGDAPTIDAFLAMRSEEMEWVGSTFVLSVEGGTFYVEHERGR